MSDMALFEGTNSLVSSDLFKSLQEADDNLAGGGGGGGSNRISLRGGRFRQMVSGEQVNVKSDGILNVVIINAAKLSRTFYQGAYDPENPAPPACWSPDTQKPAAEVPLQHVKRHVAWIAHRTSKVRVKVKAVHAATTSALL